ncbi:unnamed protein product [Natator depressus]
MELRGQLSSCLFCATLLAAIPFSESFEVSSSPTVTGIVGQDVVLPCQISTGTQPNNMEVQWKKIIQAPIETVHEYRAQPGQDVPGPNYQGRTMLLKDGFTSGTVSLKLKNVRPADGGTYSCIVKSNERSADAATELKIAAVASVSIDVLGPQDQGIELACRSTGWFPSPELHWVTKNGQDLQPVTKTEQDHELLFSILSHVTVLGEETGEISCVIQNSLLKTEQKSVILLSGDIFPHVSPWLAAFWVLFTFSLLAIGACAFFGYKVKQKRSKKKTSKEETLFLMEWRRVRNNSDDITLDADTAHPNLSIAPNKKSLKHEAQPQKVPANTERFDSTVCVLGSKGFFSGKHYWEVEVVSSTDWDLGVARTSIQRKGKLSLSPKEGFWALGLSGRDYWAKTDPWTRVMVQKKPQKIGVYLSHQDRQVTFLNVTDMSVLFIFNDCSFSGEVYPFFKNSHKETTMRICSIKEE